MELLATATLAPGCCAICVSAAGPFVDTRRTAPYGRVYVCRRCVRDLASVIGENDRTVAQPDRTAEVEAELRALRGRFEHLQRAVHLTLTEGVAIRRGKIALRSQRGQPGFELEV